MGEKDTNFEAEIQAIRQSITKLPAINASHRKAALLVDSQAAILSVWSHKEGDSVCMQEIKGLFSNIIAMGLEIMFQWLPSHCGIPGNKSISTY